MNAPIGPRRGRRRDPRRADADADAAPPAALVAAVADARAAPGDFAGPADLLARAAGPEGGDGGLGAARVERHYHLTPAALLRRARVHHAARAIAGGAAPGPACADAGFAEATEADAAFRRYLGLAPPALADLAGARVGRGRTAGFALALPPGATLDPLVHLMDRDPSAACERVDRGDELVLRRGFDAPADGAGAAAARVGAVRAVLTLRPAPGGGEVRVSVEPTAGAPVRGPTLLAAHALAVRLLGLASETTGLADRAQAVGWLAPLLARRPGLGVPLMGSPFEALVWAVLGQQVNLAFAASLRATLIRLATGADDAARLLPHPRPEAVAALDPADLHAARFSRSKATWIVALAEQVAAGRLPLDTLAATAPAGVAETALLACKGVGPWTAQYVMLRGMGFDDCLPAADAGLTRSLQRVAGLPERPGPGKVHDMLAPLRPWRSIVCQHLWSAPAGAGTSRRARRAGAR